MNTPISDIAKQMMADPKGLLAADESSKTCQKRFDALKIDCTDESRRKWRQLLCMSPNIELYISGVILYDETIRQKTDDGLTFAEALSQKGIIPGIKVDMGLVPMNNFEPATITEGLDSLSGRLEEYYNMGARFTKWRSAFEVSGGEPDETVIRYNLMVMARYASIAQSNGMVPIVEPEVLYEGDHTIEQAAKTTQRVIKILFEELYRLKVNLSGAILKTSMVLAGTKGTMSKPAEVAEATLKVLNNSVPKEVAGVVFLSGGQSPDQATANLNAIGIKGEQPWPITYSYSRAVQDPVLKIWRGKQPNTKKAQAMFSKLLARNSAARNGQFIGKKVF